MNHPNCVIYDAQTIFCSLMLYLEGPNVSIKVVGVVSLLLFCFAPKTLQKDQVNWHALNSTLQGENFKSNIISPAGRESKQLTWKKPQRKSFNFQNFLKEFEVYVLLSPCVKALFVLYIIGWLRWPPALSYLLIRCDMYVICLIKHTQHSTHHSWSESVYVN